MHPLGRALIVAVLIGLFAGCVHRPPQVILPSGPVIDYGPPGRVIR